jgi:hypothetical protein
MSIAQNLLTAGFSSILGTNGETLTFRGASLTGLVHRNLDFNEFNQTPGVPSGDSTFIEVKTSAMSNPLIGEQLTDAYGARHRIARIKKVTAWWRLECITSL